MQHMQERDGQHTTVYGMFAGMEKLELTTPAAAQSGAACVSGCVDGLLALSHPLHCNTLSMKKMTTAASQTAQRTTRYCCCGSTAVISCGPQGLLDTHHAVSHPVHLLGACCVQHILQHSWHILLKVVVHRPPCGPVKNAGFLAAPISCRTAQYPACRLRFCIMGVRWCAARTILLTNHLSSTIAE